MTSPNIAAVAEGLTPDEARIVDWLRAGRVPPASIHSWADRFLNAWWALKNPNVGFAASRLAMARAIERGEHRKALK